MAQSISTYSVHAEAEQAELLDLTVGDVLRAAAARWPKQLALRDIDGTGARVRD